MCKFILKTSLCDIYIHMSRMVNRGLGSYSYDPDADKHSWSVSLNSPHASACCRPAFCLENRMKCSTGFIPAAGRLD